MFLRVHHLTVLTGFRRFLCKPGHISTFSTEALEGSSKTYLREKRKRGERGRARDLHLVVTLDPKKFTEKKQKCFHIMTQQTLTAYVLLHKQSSPVLAARLFYDHSRITGTMIYPPYPPNTTAFLYYSVSPERPRIGGELRFRVTSSDDPASFESGSDLLRTNGRPWFRSLLDLSKYYPPLYEKLREERLVPDDLDTALSTLPKRFNTLRRQLLLNLYTLNDTFIVELNSFILVLSAITEQGIEKVPFHKIFFDGRATCKDTPYTGSALVRFERSSLPEHEGTRTVVLRILKIITPVKCVIPLYDGFVCCPKEGELHRRPARKHSRTVNWEHSVWSVNIDKSKGTMIPGLRLLWDT